MNQTVTEDIVTRRRAIAKRVKSRLAARGTPVDDNPRYDALVERWIAGEIEMQDVARGYAEIRAEIRGIETSSRSSTPADDAVVPRFTEADDMIGGIEKFIGIYEPDVAVDR